MTFPQFSAGSTGLSETSSDGLSVQNYTRLWNPERLVLKSDQGPAIRASFLGTVNSPGQAFSFWTESGGEEAIKRLLGCVLVSIIPAEGIDEALTSLKEILEYHLENVRYKLPEPEITHRGTGKISGISERPDLIISE